MGALAGPGDEETSPTRYILATCWAWAANVPVRRKTAATARRVTLDSISIRLQHAIHCEGKGSRSVMAEWRSLAAAQRTKLSGACRRAPQDARRTRVRLSAWLGRAFMLGGDECAQKC